MQFNELVLQGADPGANLGAAFTASLAERELVPKGAYLHEFLIGLKADTATAAVTAATALALLNPFVFKVGQETRIQLRARDLLALNMFLYGSVPLNFQADTINDDFKFLGIKVPIWEKIDPNQNYAWSATRVAQTNVSGEVFELAAVWSDKVLNPAPIYAVEQPFTSAGSTGRTNLNILIPKVGNLIGMLIFNTTALSNTADTTTIQRVQFYLDGKRHSQFNAGTMGFLRDFNQETQDLFNQAQYINYSFIDLRDDPIDVKASELAIEVDVQATSEAARLIPIIVKT